MNKNAFIAGFLKAAKDKKESPGYLRRLWAQARLPYDIGVNEPISQYLGQHIPNSLVPAAGLGLPGAPWEAYVNSTAEKRVNAPRPPWSATLLKSLATGGLGAASTGLLAAMLSNDPRLVQAMALGGGLGGLVSPTINRAVSNTVHPEARQRAAVQAQKHPILSTLPFSSFFNAYHS